MLHLTDVLFHASSFTVLVMPDILEVTNLAGDLCCKDVLSLLEDAVKMGAEIRWCLTDSQSPSLGSHQVGQLHVPALD